MKPALAPGYHVRPALEADLPGLPALGGEPLAALDLCRAAGTLWVGTAGERPVAYLAAGEADSSLLVLALVVAPEHRRRGLGAALLGLALDHARWAFYPAASAIVAGAEGAFLAAHGFLRLRAEALSPALADRLAARLAAPGGGDGPGRPCAVAKRL